MTPARTSETERGPRTSRAGARQALSFTRTASALRSPADLAWAGPAADRDVVFRRLLVLADVCSAALAMLCCVALLGADGIQGGLLLVLPLVLVLSKVMGLYDRDDVLISRSTLDELPTLFQLATLYTLLVWLTEAPAVGERSPMLGLWVALFVFAALARMTARAVGRRTTAPERCLVIGTEATCRWLKGKFRGAQVHADLVGSIRLDGPDGTPPMQRIHAQLAALDVDRVIIALRWESEADSLLELISGIKSCGCKVSLMPRMLEVVGSSVVFEDIDGVPVLGVRRFGLSRSSRAVKRALDVALSSCALIASAPLMALLAVAIKLDSPGPVLFRQARVGRDGATFRMLKFRSMVEGADARKQDLMHLNEAHGLFKITNDPRVTRIGRWIRCTSLDELPQLINVLRGEMSLVGPRPLVHEDDRRIHGWHRRRLHLKPGMTGPWQILGSSRIPLEEMVTIDYLYVANWSLWTDVKILLRTVAHVVGRRGR
jgi:exopolysaccharide biosynthesis polyprenyl glycosylphosphotransferase